jgi:hypothetical protein
MMTRLELVCAAETWLLRRRIFVSDHQHHSDREVCAELVDVRRRVLAKLERRPTMRRPEALLRDLDEAIAATKEGAL